MPPYGVAIRSSSKSPCFQGFQVTDRHTSDIGHWFAMTETNFVYSLSFPRWGKHFPFSVIPFLYQI